MAVNKSFDPSPIQPGDTLAGRYRVERVLGVGGMGVVVAARHLQLDHLVAVKFLLPEVLANSEAVNRFAREARAAVKIQNEHVARVTDVGTLETGAPYMVMEYLEGSDLATFVRAQRHVAVEDAVDFILQASEAIAEAHSLGIVHRDLKPGNLFLLQRADGSRIVKVLDFGISKTSGMVGSSASAAMTSTSAMMGSPLYMSPEQLNSARDVDVRTDIWALGIILHELLTGRVPFVADTIPQLCVAILHAPPASLRSARSDVPAGLEAVVLRCLEKDRARRYANVGELARALSEFAAHRSNVSVERISHLIFGASSDTGSPAAAPTSAPREETVPVSAFGTQGSWGSTARDARRAAGRRILAALAALAVIALVVVIVRGFSTRTASEPENKLAASVNRVEPAAPTLGATGEMPMQPIEVHPPLETLEPEQQPSTFAPAPFAPEPTTAPLPRDRSKSPHRSLPPSSGPRLSSPPRKIRGEPGGQPPSAWEDERK